MRSPIVAYRMIQRVSQWHQEDEHEVEQTAICARCNIDGVIPDKAGHLLTIEFMTKMHNYWMEPVKEYSATELVDESTIDYLNTYYLRPKGFRIEIGNELEPYINYLFVFRYFGTLLTNYTNRKIN